MKKLPMIFLFVLAALVPVLVAGCASLQPVLSTIDQVAQTLCVDFFSKQDRYSKRTPTQVAQQLCATAQDLAPFIDAAKEAEASGGRARLAAHPQ